jgi:hypothetical protein
MAQRQNSIEFILEIDVREIRFDSSILYQTLTKYKISLSFVKCQQRMNTFASSFSKFNSTCFIYELLDV